MNATTKRQRHLARKAIAKAIKQLESAIALLDGDDSNKTDDMLMDARDSVQKAANHLIVPTSTYAKLVKSRRPA